MKRSDITDAEVIDAILTHPFSFTTTGFDDLTRKYPRKLVEAKYLHMVNRGLLDYGVSLRTAWVVNPEAVKARAKR